ncbi:MAG TPA: translocation/assembly module TamB domain-containing protein [Thermoanaerobaculia bacterium]|nr:translocation/assembly module TamB domain-containing protein [Thermoanaerobaculia bacterium]
MREAPSPPARRRFGRLRRFVLRPLVWGGVLAVVLVALLLGFLGSATARERAAALIVARLSEAVGRPVRVGSVDFSFLPLEFELRDLVIPGRGPKDPPIAEVPVLHVRITGRALRDNRLDLEQIEAIRPTVRLEFREDGSTNLPAFRSSGGGGSRFEVRVGRILIQNGTFFLNERRLPLELEARAIWGRVVGPNPKHLEALATAQDVRVVLPDARPYHVTVSAKGRIEPGKVTVTSYRFAGLDAKVRGRGEYAWNEKGYRVGFDAAGEGNAALLNRWGYLADPIAARFSFTGRIDADPESWGWRARMNAPRLAYLGREATEIAARGQGNSETVDIDVERARYAEGNLAGKIAVDLTVSGPGKPIAIDLAFKDLDAARFLTAEGLDLAVASRGAGTFRYRAKANDLLAGDGDIALQLAAVPGVPGAGPLPVAGDLPLRLDHGVLSSAGYHLTAQALTAEGTASFDLPHSTGRIDARLATGDLAATARILPAAAEPEIWRPTAGRGTAELKLGIQAKQLTTEIAFDLADVRSPALSADTLVGSLAWLPDRIEDLQAEARRGAARLAVAGRIPLAASGRGLALELSTSSWPAAELARLAPGLPEIGGLASGRATLAGSFDELTGRADLEVADLAVAGQALGAASGAISFAGPKITVERALFTAPGGELSAAGSIDRRTGAVALSAEAPALDLAAEPFHGLLGIALAGKASLHASVAGTLDHPEATVTARATGLALDGRAFGPSGSAQLVGHWDGEALEAHGSLLGLVTFAGGGRLDRAGADLDFSLESSNLRGLAQIATAGANLPEISGGFSGRAKAAADFTAGTFRTSFELPRLEVAVADRRLKNLEPVIVKLSSERLEIASFYMGEAATGSDLFATGTIGFGPRGGPGGGGALDLKLQSTLSATWVKIFAPTVDLTGTVDLLATVRGTLDRPAVRGEGELRDARMILPSLPSAFEDLRGTILFNRDEIVFDGFRARVGGGGVLASGRLAIPQGGSDFDYAFQLLAEDLSLRYPEGFLSRGSGEITFASVKGGRQVRGEVRLDRCFYLEDVEVGTLELLLGAFRRARQEVEEADPFLASTSLNVRVVGPGALRVRNNVADLRGDIDLSVRGSLARPVIFGSVEIQEGGKLRYAENEYRIERGRITFDNPSRIDPVIDLTAKTEVRSYEIALDLSGTLDRLNAHFRSEDGLADLDILSLLATGREFDRSTGNGTTLPVPGSEAATAAGQGGAGAAGFLASQAASAVSQRVRNLFGFDRFRIDPLAGSNDSISSVQVTVGKRLSKKLFVTYTSAPSSTQTNVIQAEWQVGKNVVLLLTYTGTGSFSVDAQWERRY